jgi:enolase
VLIMTEIVAIRGREILDSWGNPTLEVELATASGSWGGRHSTHDEEGCER